MRQAQQYTMHSYKIRKGECRLGRSPKACGLGGTTRGWRKQVLLGYIKEQLSLLYTGRSKSVAGITPERWLRLIIDSGPRK